jgi:S1-C subfamily serine protease
MSTGARSEYEQNSIDVFKALAPSVVFVTNKQIRRNQWTRRKSEVKAGAGTGFIWDRRGHIVTNFHVVNKGTAFEVTMYDGTVLAATFVGGDPMKDIAVLKIAPPRGIRPVTLPALKSIVEPGQKAIAIGNPFGFDHTLTVGVISAIGREMPGFGGVTIRDMLQTDASINPGNSGGPLLDSEGHLIGMNTMISGTSGDSSGVGFAVPVSAIRRAVPDIIKFGRVKRAGLGVTLYPDKDARANGIVGVVIDKVKRGTPAAKAGLRGLQTRKGQVLLGDVIVGINTFKISNYDQLYNALDRYGVGDTIDVTILRGAKRTKVSLKLMQLE